MKFAICVIVQTSCYYNNDGNGRWKQSHLVNTLFQLEIYTEQKNLRVRNPISLLKRGKEWSEYRMQSSGAKKQLNYCYIRDS